MLELCYVSSANDKYQEPQLVQLLSQARAKNQRLGVTGLLLYDGVGTFIQALEGDEEVVQHLFERIKQDDRHKRVNILGIRHIQERSFCNWCMGFRSLNHPEMTDMDGFSDFLNVPVDKFNSKAQGEPGFALRMLHYFKERARSEAEDKHNI